MITLHYADEHLLIAEKPAGLLTVPGKGPDKQDCLINRLRQNYPTALTVHRLDMATSGMLVIALTKKVHRLMSEQFALRKIEKNYIAVVDGVLGEQKGQVDLPLICDWPNRPRQKVDYEIGKPSLTLYNIISIDSENDTSRVCLVPVTGRSHQLRVHMLSIGHTIVGDRLYATEKIAKQSDRLLLHAHSLSFKHPITDQKINVISPVPF